MLLVDGSWSIGRMNFKTIRSFIARMVSVFDIGPDKVQIGNVDPSCEVSLRSIVFIMIHELIIINHD